MPSHCVYQSDNATLITRVFYNSEYREYVVKLYINGTHYEPADYFTDDKDDAIATAEHMLAPDQPRKVSKEFRDKLARLHNPELAKVEGAMVYQVWEDGEVTLQKCGSLLWRRTLHTIAVGDPTKMVDPEAFPMNLCAPGASYKHGYIFTTSEGADEIRRDILGL